MTLTSSLKMAYKNTRSAKGLITYLLRGGCQLLEVPDRDRLVRREVDHGLGGEEPVDLPLGAELGVEQVDINLDLVVSLVWLGVHVE